MPGGLAALLDDVSLIARTAAASVDDVAAAAVHTSAKAAGVVIDDTAVAPQYVAGVTPARELPIIWKIAKGSLRNKLIIILPIALLLSWIAPGILTPILMLGGLFLTFEGMEKILEIFLERFTNTTQHAKESVQTKNVDSEDKLVKSAITTDLILSAEIMVISLNEVADMSFWPRTLVLIIVGIFITFAVYGAVGLLVKIDDLGMKLMRSTITIISSLGTVLVRAMPLVLTIISIIGTAAMLWVGGHLLITGVDTLGWHWPYTSIHHLIGGLTGAGAWMVETACSMVIGALIGIIIALIVHFSTHKKRNH